MLVISGIRKPGAEFWAVQTQSGYDQLNRWMQKNGGTAPLPILVEKPLSQERFK